MAKLGIGSALAHVCAQLAESVAGQISWQTCLRGCGTSQQRLSSRQEATITNKPLILRVNVCGHSFHHVSGALQGRIPHVGVWISFFFS